MSEFESFDLERTTARAWSHLQVDLAARVAELGDEEYLVVGVEPGEDDEVRPYVQFAVDGSSLRFEVSSNEYLTGVRRLVASEEAALQALGLEEPTVDAEHADADGGSPNYFLDAEISDADRLAVMAVRVLRDVFSVPHPAFLASEGLYRGGPAGPEDFVEVDEPVAIVPTDRDHLCALVDEALAPVFGRVPEHDDDDDIPVVRGSALVFVRVRTDGPIIEIFSSVVGQITDLETAAFEVAVLNRDSVFIRYVLAGDRVMAYLCLPAHPFVPAHLHSMLALMSEAADVVDGDLARRVGGRPYLVDEAPSPEDDEEPMHPAMLTLLQLDAESPSSVDPELAASICSNDRDLLLELITWNTGQEISWRQARDDALMADDDDAAELFDTELRQAEQTTNLLRQALRVVVEAERSTRQKRRRRPSAD